MEKRRVRFRRKFREDIPMKILATVLAVVIWFILSITLYPTIFMSVEDVPVTISLEGTAAEAEGLSVVDFPENLSVDVSFNGRRYEIGSYTEKDLHASIDVSGISTSGSYDLPIKVTCDAPSCVITKITPSSVKVKLEYIKSVSVPLQVRAASISAEDGYTLGSPAVSPTEINVKGPQNLVEEISYAVFVIDRRETLSEAFTTSDGKVVLYSADGAIIDDSVFETDYEPISVTFPVYFLKTLRFSFDYQGVPPNFDTGILKYSLSEESIDIMTSNEGILNQDELHLGYINLSNINLEDSFTFDVHLDSGQTSTSGTDKVTVTFDPAGFASKEFTISEGNIKLINVPNNVDARLLTKAIPSVTVYGPADVMNMLSADDLIAEFDMQSTKLDDGTYTRSVRIYSPQIGTVWAYGSYEIVFSISEKSPAVTSFG